ncbi:bifunctional molybdenum cofactor biosynthesis protein MoaC/MoaB [Lujinxingia litoralis]|uniref:Bifunctional molybdenum cofactor biosynthesis protein MoaC/MoaB n=1 Tax=Lujinxingia litoralis TaxID=2211119 RepID=A0A328C2X4_9DELT|nr:cyclic pyranopterin monophosphate synthase MoaC [Lujinxingia litoralis]RAL21143.1 bifunctional molybdenum cofactor biosynthesis protein MoaC/MoaB [Lujinxingia litoralis]
MKDITHKPTSERFARAQAMLRIDPAILRATGHGRNTDKGDAIEASRVAGIMAVKRTWEALPFCHPLAITACDVHFEFLDEGIYLEVSATCVGPTGVEMETLYAASVAAMNLYDMLKPHASADTGLISVTDIKLVEKRGGKSDFRDPVSVRAAIVVTSDAVVSGVKEDRAGHIVRDRLLKKEGVDIVDYIVLGNDPAPIAQTLDALLARDLDLIVTVGGTGLEPHARTVEVVEQRIQRPIPGIMEAARQHGQARTPRALLSRGVAGQAGHCLLVTFPGSSAGARQTCDAVLTGLLASVRPAPSSS